MRRRISEQRGLTLIEVLVSSMLSIIVLTAVLGAFYTTIYTLLAAFVFYGKEL